MMLNRRMIMWIAFPTFMSATLTGNSTSVTVFVNGEPETMILELSDSFMETLNKEETSNELLHLTESDFDDDLLVGPTMMELMNTTYVIHRPQNGLVTRTASEGVRMASDRWIAFGNLGLGIGSLSVGIAALAANWAGYIHAEHNTPSTDCLPIISEDHQSTTFVCVQNAKGDLYPDAECVYNSFKSAGKTVAEAQYGRIGCLVIYTDDGDRTDNYVTYSISNIVLSSGTACAKYNPREYKMRCDKSQLVKEDL